MTTYVDTAKAAVQVHAAAIRAAFVGRDHAITDKADTTIVTQTDLDAERAMRTLIADRHPDHAILGEELGESAGSSDYRWVLDPIDGTTNFARGFPIFVSAACLMRADEPVASAIYHPVLDDLFWATTGGGAYLNGERLALGDGQTLSAAIVGFTRRRDAKQATGTILDRLEPRVTTFRVFGSGLYSLAQVARGRLDAVVALKQHLWDVVPGLLIATEAGATAVDFTGQPWTPRSQELILAHHDLARQLVDALTKQRE